MSLAALYLLGQVLVLFGSVILDRRAMKSADRAEDAARKTELTIDPLDAGRAAKELLDAVSAARKDFESIGGADRSVCRACGCPFNTHTCFDQSDCIRFLRNRNRA